jgi:bifunctional DNA-binding transcriptional regulator/antitoxin component of YhaV-PrlF toxin-antitoxin module
VCEGRDKDQTYALVKRQSYQVGGPNVATAEKFKVSSSGQMSLPAAVRRRWHLERGGRVDVLDLGFGVLTLPAGYRGRLVDELLPAEDHYRAVAGEDDPDLRS